MLIVIRSLDIIDSVIEQPLVAAKAETIDEDEEAAEDEEKEEETADKDRLVTADLLVYGFGS